MLVQVINDAGQWRIRVTNPATHPDGNPNQHKAAGSAKSQ